MTNDQLIRSPKYLFGAGGAASWVLQGFRREGVQISGFIDDSAVQIGKVAGLPVITPDAAEATAAERAASIVIFTVMNPAVRESAVRDRLLGLGWGSVLSLSEFGKSLFQKTGQRCAMLDAKEMDLHTIELSQARTLLCDDHSKQVYDAFIRFVQKLDDSGFPEITPKPYFPDDLPRWSNPLRIIDCGGFDGDTLRSALTNCYQIEASASFEPDPRNFVRLAKNIKQIMGAQAWPCGVSDRTETLRFSAQGDTGSSVNSSGELSIQCVSLDEALPHFAPNLIKFDIEGSEQAALRGAENLIREFRPGLAVSVYHLPTDIWRIPLFLSSILGTKCKYYLRRHSRTIADTVLYVYPNG